MNIFSSEVINNVVITSKTKMKDHLCVGGITEDYASVRLLNYFGDNQPMDTQFDIGSLYQISYRNGENLTPPHIEDIYVRSYKLLRENCDLIQYIKSAEQNNKIKIFRGPPRILFDNKLRWTAFGSGYIGSSAIPGYSTAFWVPDQDLTRYDNNYKVRYQYVNYNHSEWYQSVITYVGEQKPQSIIDAGSLLRVSLARWWTPDTATTEKRCYLQLSGVVSSATW